MPDRLCASIKPVRSMTAGGPSIEPVADAGKIPEKFSDRQPSSRPPLEGVPVHGRSALSGTYLPKILVARPLPRSIFSSCASRSSLQKGDGKNRYLREGSKNFGLRVGGIARIVPIRCAPQLGLQSTGTTHDHAHFGRMQRPKFCQNL